MADAATRLMTTDEFLAWEHERTPKHELVDGVPRMMSGGTQAHSLLQGNVFAALRAGLVDGFGPVLDAAEAIDPNLRPALGTRRDRALLEIADAERKVLSHHKKHSTGLLAALRLVRNHLAPRGGPQERTLNVLPFLAREPQLLERLGSLIQIRWS